MIEVRNLTKRFGDFTAVDHLDLVVETGEFFGLLGPNGAGKSTTISMLSTVLLPSEGEILIDGKKLDRRAAAEKRKLSVVTQEYSMRQDMDMEEVLEYQGRLYFLPMRQIRERSERLLRFAGLAEYRKRRVRHLSGGMKRKLMVCRALLTEPEILLLDEPTAGMDALSRRQMWNLLRQLNSQKMTILLTTHSMEEAQVLCKRVALMNRGRLQKLDAPDKLIAELGVYAVDEAVTRETHKDGAGAHKEAGTALYKGTGSSRYFQDREAAIAYLENAGAEASLRQTTLEDVFLECAGAFTP